MKRIVINEKQERFLFNTLLNEEAIYLGDKEELVLNWLKSKFAPMDIQGKDDMSLPTIHRGANVLNAWGQMSDNLKDLESVFYLTQAKFKHILSNPKERDEFLKQCINKWYETNKKA
jgi:Trp operon repressor